MLGFRAWRWIVSTATLVLPLYIIAKFMRGNIENLKQPALFRLWQKEFSGYTGARFRRDLIAGLTVAAVALPLALAFGVASSATAAAGLVTAIIAGFVIGALSGAPYQISGPTGAMSAVLVVIVQKHGLQGLWLAAIMAGADCAPPRGRCDWAGSSTSYPPPS